MATATLGTSPPMARRIAAACAIVSTQRRCGSSTATTWRLWATGLTWTKWRISDDGARRSCRRGDVPYATYRNHGTHAEAIEVFDPAKISSAYIGQRFITARVAVKALGRSDVHVLKAPEGCPCPTEWLQARLGTNARGLDGSTSTFGGPDGSTLIPAPLVCNRPARITARRLAAGAGRRNALRISHVPKH